MENGWIKLHRKVLENPICRKPKYLSIWIHLLLMANHKEAKMMWNGEILSIHEGQFITGRKELSLKTGIPETTIEDILNFLERQQQIRQQKTTKFRLITVINWEKYQISDTKSDNKPTTKRQQADTNKNNNNNKNEKNNASEPKDSQDIVSFIDLWKDINPAYRNFFQNKTERSAAGSLLKISPIEDWKIFIPLLQKMNAEQYAKKSTKPTELLKNIGHFKAWTDQKRKPDPKRKVAIIPNE